MARKYFFFDYDGTLAVPRTRDIPEDTRYAIEKLRENGHFIALATGRLQCNALDYIEALGINNIIADGGYSVTLDGELLWMKSLDIDMARACMHRLDDTGLPWAVQTVNEMYRLSNQADFAEVAGDYYVPTVYDPDLNIDDIQECYKIYIPNKAHLAAQLEEAGVLEGVPWVVYDSGNLFVEPLEKSLGIKWLMDKLGAPYEDVVVFGDGTNDISMFCPEWTSIAMGNAVDELKKNATFVTDDCDKGGILNACKKFGWID